MSNFKDHSAGYLANHMARLFAAGLQKRIQPLGLAPAQFMVLLELWDGDGKTQADLVAALDVEQATMANTLARMERDGLIDRRISDTDKRARNVFLTDHAKGLQAEAMVQAKAENQLALSGLSEDEQQQFRALMHTVIATLIKR